MKVQAFVLPYFSTEYRQIFTIFMESFRLNWSIVHCLLLTYKNAGNGQSGSRKNNLVPRVQ